MRILNRALSAALAVFFAANTFTAAILADAASAGEADDNKFVIELPNAHIDLPDIQSDLYEEPEWDSEDDYYIVESGAEEIVSDGEGLGEALGAETEETESTDEGAQNILESEAESAEADAEDTEEILEPDNDEAELQDAIAPDFSDTEAAEDAVPLDEVELMALIYFTGRYRVVGKSAKIRLGYSSEYAVNHELAKGSYLDIVEVKFNWDTWHYWGKTRQGRWTCLDNGNLERVSGIVKDGQKYEFKAGVATRKGPSTGYALKSAPTGSVITISEIHYNDFGNPWGKISGGGTYCYVYMDNVVRHTCSYSAVKTTVEYKVKNSDKHTKIVSKTASTCRCGSVRSAATTEKDNYEHDYNLGYCKTCGYLFNLQYKSINNKYYEVKNSSTPVRTVPYSEQAASDYYPAGKVVRICQSTTNCQGSLWYKTTDGHWIYSGNLSKHSHDYENGLCTNKTCRHKKEINEHSISATLYEITEASVALKDRPYGSETTVKGTVSGKGTTIKIVGYCYNQYWNKWYKTSDGYWVFEDYVTEHKKHNYSAGVCTNKGCGAEFKLSEKNVNKQYITNQANVVAREKPYSNAGGVKTLPKGYVVTVKTKAKNSAGNWWYKTSDGYWIYSERLDEHKHSYVGGVCKSEGCGSVYNLDIKTYSKTKTLYTNKLNVVARANPYSTGEIKKNYEKLGTGVKINAEVKNASKNVWYRTTDGYWIFEDNLSSHAHTFTGDSEGKCSKAFCGYEWPYKVVTMTPTSYFVVSDSAPMWKRPYADSGKKDTKSKDDVITIVAKTTNYFGNLWYKDNRGLWIAAKHVDLRKAVKPAEGENGGKVNKNEFILSVVDTSRKAIKDATVYFGDSGSCKTDKNGQAVLDYTKASTYLKIEIDGYEPYENSKYTMSTLKRDTIILGKEDKSEFIKAELSYDKKVVDVLKTTQKIDTYNENLYFTLTCKATGSKVAEYRIKGKDTTFTAKDGVFKDLCARDFKIGQKVEVKAYDKAGELLATKKLMLDVIYTDPDAPNEITFGLPIKIKIPKTAPLIGGTNIEIPLKASPVYITMNSDGDIRGGINIKYYDSSEGGKLTWDQVKSLNAEKFEKLDFKTPKPSQPFELSSSVGGYIEGNLGGKLSGKLFVTVSLDAYKEFQVPNPLAIPLVFELSFEAKATADGMIEWTKVSGFECSTGLEVVVEVGGYLGIGSAGLLSAGGYAKGQFGIDLRLSSKTGGSLSAVWVDLVFGVKVKLLGKNVWDTQIGNLGKKYLVQNGVELSGLPEYWDSLDFIYDSSAYVTMDRDYLDKRSGWYPDADGLLMEDGAEAATIVKDYEFHRLQMNSYTDIRPQVVSINELSMMLYVDDDANRDINNRTVLVYSVYDDAVGMWSEPQPVCDDLTADYIFDVMSDGENIFVVWQNAKKIFDGSEGIEEIAVETDLYIAKYDIEANEFVNVERVTDNDKYEMMPSVSHGNEKIIVSWLENENNDVFARNGKNSVVYATKTDDEYPQSELVEELNGGTSSADNPDSDENEEVLYPEGEVEDSADYEAWINAPWDSVEYAVDEPYITSMSAGNLYEGDYIAYTVDEDGDYTTVEDQAIWLLSIEDNTAMLLTDKAMNAEFVPIHGDNTLTWYNDGRIYYLIDPEYAPQIICEETAVPGDEYHILTDDNGDMVILYTKSIKNGSEAYMLKYEDATYEWGLPIKITQQELYIKNFNGAYKNGKIIGVFNQIEVDDELHETNTLCTVTIGERHDISITDVYYDEATLAPGENNVKLTVKNNGNTTVYDVSVKVYDEAEELVSEESVNVNLRIGDTATIDTQIVMPEEIEKTTFKICVEEADVTDEKMSDNIEFIDIGLPQLTVELMSYVTDEETVITAIVTNVGYDTAGGSIALFREDGSIYQIVCDDIDELESGDVYTYSFVLDADYFEGEMYKSVVVGVICDTEQSTDSYNIASEYLKNPKVYEMAGAEVIMEDSGDSSGDEIVLMEDTDAKISSVLTNTTEADIENAQICVTAYDERGVFVDIVYIEDVMIPVGDSHEFSFDYSEESVYTVKIMLLDKATLLPIIETVVISESTEETELTVDPSIPLEEVEY